MARGMNSRETWEPVRDALGRFVAGFGRSLSGKSRGNRDEIRRQREEMRELDNRPLGPHASSYGVDADGNAMPYLLDRPGYAPGQVDEVWDRTRTQQLQDLEDGVFPGPDDVLPEGPLNDNQMYLETEVEGVYEIVTYNSGDNRFQNWDMGHLSGRDYASLHDSFMRGEIDRDTFVAAVQNPNNYEAQHWRYNQWHRGE